MPPVLIQKKVHPKYQKIRQHGFREFPGTKLSGPVALTWLRNEDLEIQSKKILDHRLQDTVRCRKQGKLSKGQKEVRHGLPRNHDACQAFHCSVFPAVGNIYCLCSVSIQFPALLYIVVTSLDVTAETQKPL